LFNPLNTSLNGNTNVAGNFTIGTNKVTVDPSTGDVVIQGNLTVNGTQTTIDSTTVSTSDKNIVVNKGGTTIGAVGAGISVEGDSGAIIASFEYDTASPSEWYLVDSTNVKHEIVTNDATQTLTNKTIDLSGASAVTLGAAVGSYGADLEGALSGMASDIATLQTAVSGVSETILQTDTTVGYAVDGTDPTKYNLTVPAMDTTKPIRVFVSGLRLSEGASNDYTIQDATTVQFNYDITAGGANNPNIVIEYIPQ
jgi:hypothetical protein